MNYDLIPVLTEGLNLDNILTKTRVIGTVMRWGNISEKKRTLRDQDRNSTAI